MMGRLDSIAVGGRGTARHAGGARVVGRAMVGGHDTAGNMTSGPMAGDEDARLHRVHDAWNHITAAHADDGGQQGAGRLACVRVAVHVERRAPAPRVAPAAGAHAIRREAINDRWLPGTSPEFPTTRKLFTSPFHSNLRPRSIPQHTADSCANGSEVGVCGFLLVAVDGFQWLCMKRERRIVVDDDIALRTALVCCCWRMSCCMRNYHASRR